MTLPRRRPSQPNEFTIQVEGLAELRAGIKAMDPKLAREMGKTNRKVGKFLADKAAQRKGRLAGMFPSYSSRIVKIKPSTSQKQVVVTVFPAAAEYGAKVHTVFGRRMAAGEMRRRVWPAWSGNQWQAGPSGDVGYLVFPTLREEGDEVADEYGEAVGRLVRDITGG